MVDITAAAVYSGGAPNKIVCTALSSKRSCPTLPINQIFMDGFMPRMIAADRGGGQATGGARLWASFRFP